MRLGSRLGKIVTLDPNYDPRVWPDKVEAWEVLAEVMPYVTIVKPSSRTPATSSTSTWTRRRWRRRP